jgi:hypothetical protein
MFAELSVICVAVGNVGAGHVEPAKHTPKVPAVPVPEFVKMRM